jgi:hypothetical protein
MGKGSVELLEHALGCNLAAARAIYNGEATAPDILVASSEPAPRRSRGSSRSKAPVATNGHAARQVSGTNPEPGAQDVSPMPPRAGPQASKNPA